MAVPLSQWDPLGTRLRRLAGNLLGYAQNRLELLGVELAQERARVGSVLTCGLLMMLFGMLTLQFGALLLVALSWDSAWRVPVIATLSALALAATVVSAWAWARKRQSASALFVSSSAEIGKDRRALEFKTPL